SRIGQLCQGVFRDTNPEKWTDEFSGSFAGEIGEVDRGYGLIAVDFANVCEICRRARGTLKTYAEFWYGILYCYPSYWGAEYQYPKYALFRGYIYVLYFR